MAATPSVLCLPFGGTVTDVSKARFNSTSEKKLEYRLWFDEVTGMFPIPQKSER
jgi:hypothetical protein